MNIQSPVFKGIDSSTDANETKKNARTGFFAALVSMVITHGFCFTNLMYSHDSLFFTTYGVEKISLGRWFYPFVTTIRTIASPYLMGIFSILFVSLAVYYASRFLKLSAVNALILAVIFSTNLTLTSLFCTYIFDADADCLALLLICFSLFAIENDKRFVSVLGIICLTASLALYQTYICLFATLILFFFIKKATEIDKNYTIKSLLKELLRYALVFCFSFAIYLVFMKLFSFFFDTELSTGYNGPGRLKTLSILDFLKFPKQVLFFFCHFLLGRTWSFNNLTVFLANLFVVLCIIGEVVAIVRIYKNRPAVWILILMGIILLPFAVFGYLLISQGTSHDLMIYAAWMMYFLPFWLLTIIKNGLKDNSEKQIKWMKMTQISILVVVGLFSFRNVCYANTSYLYKKLVYDNTLLHAQSVWKDLQEIPNYEEGVSPVVILGFENSAAGHKNRDKIIKRNILFDFSLTGETTSAITYPGTDFQMFNTVLGRAIKFETERDDITSLTEITDMPSYPKAGYIKEIDGLYIVKMSDIVQ